MKNKLFTTLSVIASLLPPALTASGAEIWNGSVDTDWEGQGTAASPYIIGTAAELAGLAQRTNADETFEGKYFRLTADLWLSDEASEADRRPLWIPIGDYALENDDPESNPGGFYAKEHWFKGTFDGNGHTIYNLWYTGTTDFDDWNDPFGSGQLDFTAWNKALFGLLDGAVITNLNIRNANIAGTALIGGLAVRAKNSTVSDVTVHGSVKSGDIENGGSAAALVVEAYDCRFTRCSADANVFARSNSGVLIGRLEGSSVVDGCSASGKVTGCVNVGGLIGASVADGNSGKDNVPVVTNSTASALVTVIPGRNQGNNGGGFIGHNEGYIACSGATGDVHVTVDCGAGFCDTNYGFIESCYATGDVYNEEYGVTLSQFVTSNGIDVGYESHKGTIYNCFGVGALRAPEAPGDVVAAPTRLSRFAWGAFVSAGSAIVGCYYDSTTTPEPTEDFVPGVRSATSDEMNSADFVVALNKMAALTGSYAWRHNPGGYPLPTDVRADDITPLFSAGGKGTDIEPYLIATKDDLKNLSWAAGFNWSFTGQYLRQTADIALNAPMEQWGEQMPEMWTPVAEYHSGNTVWTNHFCGTYDGAFHTVKNLYIDKNAPMYAGLFGVLGSGACIMNLGVVDAWVEGENYAGILVGGAKDQNDGNDGTRTVLRCWTSGHVTGGWGSGGLVGANWDGGEFYLVASYSTAEGCRRAFIGERPHAGTYIRGCWYGGKIDGDPFGYREGVTLSYFDSSKTKLNLAEGRSTEYMQSASFVNDLNYAAAAGGYVGDWTCNANAYPSFTGTKATVNVTVDDGIGGSFSFNAVSGSTLSAPVAPVREGYTFSGWYTDASFSQLFVFGETAVTEPLTLYARWTENVEPDYAIFKNKFATTFKITTAAQLYAFANIVNGTAIEVDRTDFSGKTVMLDADIYLNDVSDYEHWGSLLTPRRFTTVGAESSAPFNGTFDGQLHTIYGMFTEPSQSYAPAGMFGYLGAKAVVKDLMLKNAFVNKAADTSVALLAHSLSGIVSRCGVEGRLVSERQSQSYHTVAGLIVTAESSSTVEQCYAVVDISVVDDCIGGLIGSSMGSLSDSFARGSVAFAENGRFGGVVNSFTKAFGNCYASVALAFGTVPGRFDVAVGGTYGMGGNASVNPGYYDRDLVEKAFKLVPEYVGSGAVMTPFSRGTGLATVEMQRMASYPGWDFTTVWGRRADTNDGYPYLRWTSLGKDNDKDDSGFADIAADADGNITVYNLQGVKVYEGPRGSHNLPSGIYIVRTPSKTTKIILP